jgi:cell division protein FtsB
MKVLRMFDDLRGIRLICIIVICFWITIGFVFGVVNAQQEIDPKTAQIQALQQENYELRLRVAKLEYELLESADNVEPMNASSNPSCPRADYIVEYAIRKRQSCDGTRKDESSYEDDPIDCTYKNVFVPVCRKILTIPNNGLYLFAEPLKQHADLSTVTVK